MTWKYHACVRYIIILFVICTVFVHCNGWKLNPLWLHTLILSLYIYCFFIVASLSNRNWHQCNINICGMWMCSYDSWSDDIHLAGGGGVRINTIVAGICNVKNAKYQIIDRQRHMSKICYSKRCGNCICVAINIQVSNANSDALIQIRTYLYKIV